MNKNTNAPFTWEEIEAQVRDAILCQLSILQCLGPSSDDLPRLYIGIDPDLLDTTELEQTPAEHAELLQSIPLARHHLHHLAKNAYAYAYQQVGSERASAEDHYEIVCAVLGGFPQTDMHGNPSPLSETNDFALRKVFETFVARWALYNDDLSSGLTVKELALLSNMTIPAVRTSLSKEGFKLDLVTARGEGGRREEEKGGVLNIADALTWLSRRRGFVPNLVKVEQEAGVSAAEIFNTPGISFEVALRKVMEAQEVSVTALAKTSAASAAWIEALAKGDVVQIDVPALRSLAQALHLPEADFVARSVKHLISAEIAAAPS